MGDYESLEGFAHVRTSDGFIQVMKLSSSEDDTEDEEDEDEEDNYEYVGDTPAPLRPLPEEPVDSDDEDLENTSESRAADLYSLYACVDKSQTRSGKKKAQKEQLETDALEFRNKVGTIVFFYTNIHKGCFM